MYFAFFILILFITLILICIYLYRQNSAKTKLLMEKTYHSETKQGNEQQNDEFLNDFSPHNKKFTITQEQRNVLMSQIQRILDAVLIMMTRTYETNTLLAQNTKTLQYLASTLPKNMTNTLSGLKTINDRLLQMTSSVAKVSDLNNLSQIVQQIADNNDVSTLADSIHKQQVLVEQNNKSIEKINTIVTKFTPQQLSTQTFLTRHNDLVNKINDLKPSNFSLKNEFAALKNDMANMFNTFTNALNKQQNSTVFEIKTKIDNLYAQMLVVDKNLNDQYCSLTNIAQNTKTLVQNKNDCKNLMLQLTTLVSAMKTSVSQINTELNSQKSWTSSVYQQLLQKIQKLELNLQTFVQKLN